MGDSMQPVTLRLGDGYLVVEPHFPADLPKKLKYWRRSLGFDFQKMQRVMTGEYQELFTINQWVDPVTGQFNQRLATLPGFANRVIKVLSTAGYPYTLVDERKPLPEPDWVKAMDGLRPYQVPCVYAAIQSRGGIISCYTGFGKCTHTDTPIMFADGTVRAIGTVKVGDKLMGDDSTPRTVLERIDGFGPMYKIIPTQGKPFIVADHHILTLVRSGTPLRSLKKDGDIVNITVADYLNTNTSFKDVHKLYRVAVDFPAKPVDIDPYYVGLWLGDGTRGTVEITKPDQEIKDYLEKYGESLGLHCVLHNQCGVSLVGTSGRTNPLTERMRKYGLIGEYAAGNAVTKHIPPEFIYNSREVRLQVLAGLLDSDGNLRANTVFDFVNTNRNIADATEFIARTLGFQVTAVDKTYHGFGVTGVARRLTISGDTHLIPTKIKRKQATVRRQIKNPLRTGFTVEKVPDDNYVGVRLDGNMLHLMDDCTVLHNTHVCKGIIQAYPHSELQARNTPLTVLACPDKDITAKNYRDMAALMPDRDVGLVMSGVNRFSDDVQVITLDSLHRLNPEEVGVLIVDEVHTAAGDKRSELLNKMVHAAKWGVSATPSGRFDGRDLVTEGLFGPVVYTSTFADGVRDGAVVPIKVYWMNCPPPKKGVEKHNAYKSRVGRYRSGVFTNTNRHDLIARILRQTPETHQTLVIMQYLEHMNALAGVVPSDVRIVHAETSGEKLASSGLHNIHAIDKKTRAQIYQQMEKEEIHKIMSTYVYKQGVNFPHLEVVIQAGGGGSDIIAKQIPGRESRKTAEKEVSYLIDFWHPWDTGIDKKGKVVPGAIHADDKSRAKAYTQLGFEQVWLDDVNQLPFVEPLVNG